MKEACRIDKVLQTSVTESSPAHSSKIDHQVSTTKTVPSIDTQLVDLQKQLHNLTLLVNQKSERREEKPCFRCNRNGHIASDKAFHPDYVRRSPATGANAEPLVQPQGKPINLADHVPNSNEDALSVKRVRIEDLINNDSSKLKKPKTAMKKTVKSVKFQEESALLTKVMDTKLDVSLREVVKANPRMINEFLKCLQKQKKGKKVSFIENLQKPTHVVGEICGSKLGLYVDSGSTFCIVSAACLKSLSVPPSRNL